MIHLREIRKQSLSTPPETFPFTVPIIQSLDTLTFNTPVTFLVGDNGSGKSTLLETIALAVGSITVGAEDVGADATLADIRALAKHLRLSWSKRTRKGFFMRSEDFFGYVKYLAKTRKDMQKEVERIDKEYAERSEFAKNMAKMPFARELNAMNNSYQGDLDAHSHGESFFTLFQERFIPGGLYLLDEPEAPLSPQRQLSFLTLLHEMVKLDAQFIIATHSPIIMAYPDAQILNFDGDVIEGIAYDDLDHVSITRSFLNNPQAYLHHLLD